jgi:molybdopterin adenylyltransferase
MTEARVKSINISLKKGTVKTPVESIYLDEKGIQGDAHSGNWHRQVSLLAAESIRKFEETSKRKFNFGDFAENITTEGIELYKTRIFDRLVINEAVLEITQLGKECHGKKCAIYTEVGNCIMPVEGIFCRVIKGGEIRPGNAITLHPKIFNIQIITLSDRAYNGEYADRSGPIIKEMISSHFIQNNRNLQADITIIPDDPETLRDKIDYLIEQPADIIITTGGTGIGSRDITIETLRPMLDKEIPGIMEMIRIKYGMEKPNALISRSVAGTIGKTIIFALPGSVKAVEEYMNEIIKVLDHLILMLNDINSH